MPSAMPTLKNSPQWLPNKIYGAPRRYICWSMRDVFCQKGPYGKKAHADLYNKAVRRSAGGFTLIELLLYVSLTAGILFGVSILFSAGLSSRIKNQTIADVEQQGDAVMHIITQAVRNGDSINSPTIGASAASLSAKVFDTLKDPTVFDLSGGVVRITEGSGSAVPLTSDRIIVSGLTFQNLSRTGTSGTVRIQFTVTHVNPGGRNEYDFSQIFYGDATLR